MPSLLPQPAPDKLLEAVRIKEKFNEIFGGDEMTMPQVRSSFFFSNFFFRAAPFGGDEMRMPQELHEKKIKEKRPRASSLKSALIEP